MKTFKCIREEALNTWYSQLNRNRECGYFSDDISGSIICKWQSLFSETEEHCSFFCSFGQWLDNISDLLQNSTLDTINNYSPDDQIQALFRYYTRFLLIFSEIIIDLRDFEKNCFKIKKDWHQMICDFYKNNAESFSYISNTDKIVKYINRICKHKADKKNIHTCNQHLRIVFEDFAQTEIDTENAIHYNLSDWNKRVNRVIVPSLAMMINIIILLINRLDCIINKTPEICDTLREKGYVVKECELPL